MTLTPRATAHRDVLTKSNETRDHAFAGMTFEPRQPHERRLKHRHVQELGRRLIADLVASACDAVGGLAAGLTLLSCQISVLTYPLALASLRRACALAAASASTCTRAPPPPPPPAPSHAACTHFCCCRRTSLVRYACACLSRESVHVESVPQLPLGVYVGGSCEMI